MKSMHTRVTVRQLLSCGWKKTDIADETGCHRNTIGNIAKEELLKEKRQRSGGHPLDAHAEYIRERLGEGLSLLRIHEMLAAGGKYGSGYDAFRKYVKQKRLKRSREAFTVLHAAPGEEAQVDFGDVGKTPDNTGTLRKTYVFVMTLSHSRMGFHKTVYDQTADTFIDCHREAFEYFGGVPVRVKIDNLKAAVIRRTFEDTEFQKQYYAFSRHYDFTILPCGVRKPEQKGKVESGVKYVKRNFFAGRTFTGTDDLRNRLLSWQEHVCNRRVHGTTRRVPETVFSEQERPALRPLPAVSWETVAWETRRVGKTCHILVDGNYYSVPYRYVGETVRVRVSRHTVKIYDGKQAARYGEAEDAAEAAPDGANAVPGDTLLAVHTRLRDRGAYQTNRSHYPEGKRQTPAEAAAASGEQVRQIGPHAHAFFLQYREKRPADWGRGIAALVKLPGCYGKESVDLACKRALEFEVYSCRTVANICRKGLWRDAGCPLPVAVPDSAAPPLSVSGTGRRSVRGPAVSAAPLCGEIGRPLSYYAQLVAA